ncbi:sodium-independent sulfate anion transporter-like isoform X2 [Tigriopus californicus]|nr:sodium-independent sulfate anion transporter-like isoform X2 [Tigriopus californicus]
MSVWFAQRAAALCTRKQLLKRLPILEWLPKYNGEKAVSDLIAGITVGLTVIPQAIAYADVANLPPQYGLYSAFVGCFVYCFFGSSKDITIGPTAIMALMTAEHVHSGPEGPAFAVLLAFLSGLIIFVLGALQLGFVIDFISIPVTAGFTSAAAITIASSQVKGLFGLEITKHSHIEGVQGTWIDIVKNFKSFRYQDTILGFICIVVLLLLRITRNVNWFDSIEDLDEPTSCQIQCNRLGTMGRRIMGKLVWVVATARNAVIVIVCLLIAMGFDPEPQPPGSRNTTFILTGEIDTGLPPVGLPPFSTETMDFSGMVKTLGSAIAIIPMIAILESVAIAKAFAGGKPVDASQEMIALGLCNIGGSFFSSMPTTGSFSRTAVNAASGVKTTFGGIYTGALVILALAFLMDYCCFIPKATLSAVIITAVIFSVEYEVVRPMWRSKKTDLLCAFVTFLCCLFWALEFGILVGVGIQVLIVLYNTARPHLTIELCTLDGPGSDYLMVVIDRSLVFPSVSHVRNIIEKAGVRQGESKFPVVVDGGHIFTTDYTAAKGFKAMAKDFAKRGQKLIFYNLKPSVESVFKRSGGHVLTMANTQDSLHERLRDIFAQSMNVVVDSAFPNPGGAVDPLLLDGHVNSNNVTNPV